MKIRTDFVTNSSSSSFCVEVCIEDKKGKNYSFTDDPYDYSPDDGGTAYFHGSLKRAMNGYSDSNLADAISRDFELDDNQDKESIERAENLHVGTKVKLKVKKYDKMEWGYAEVIIQAIGKTGPLGTFYPWEGGEAIAEAIKGKKYDVEGIVTSVIPLSKRNGNARKPLIMIRVLADEKDKTEDEKNRILAFESVRDLCDFLTSSVDDDYESWDDEDDEDGYNHKTEMEEVKAGFTEEVTRNIKSLSDIKKITVTREYSAWGEFADLIADNDYELCGYAEKVVKTTGAEHQEALKNMLDYINTSNGSRAETFGSGFSDFRYSWDGDDKALEALAERLMSNMGPGDVSGTEFSEIDVETGKYTEYAVFDLK